MAYTLIQIRRSDGAKVKRVYHDSGVLLSETVVSPSTTLTSSEDADKKTIAAIKRGSSKKRKPVKRRKKAKKGKGLCTHEQVKNRLLLKRLTKIRRLAS